MRKYLISAALLALPGCGNLETVDEAVGVAIEEAVTAVPLLIENPTMPGVLTAIISVVAGIAGAAFGVAGHKVRVHKKIKDGKLGVYAKKTLDLDGSF